MKGIKIKKTEWKTDMKEVVLSDEKEKFLNCFLAVDKFIFVTEKQVYLMKIDQKEP